jgi:hypothetical protein
MALTLFMFPDHPHDYALTKVDAPLSDCVFFLDFSRPLEKRRWFGVLNRWIGPTVGLLVPVIHESEQEAAGFVVSVSRGEPYFVDLPKLWRRHKGSHRMLTSPNVDGLRIAADFGRHFPQDCIAQ